MKYIISLLAVLGIFLAPVTAYAVETPLTVATITEAGLDVTTPTDCDTGNNHSAVNSNGDVMLYLDNPGGSTATVTITAQTTSKVVAGFGTLTKADRVITLLTTETFIAGPFTSQAFNDSSGNIIITCGGAGAADINLTAAVLR